MDDRPPTSLFSASLRLLAGTLVPFALILAVLAVLVGAGMHMGVGLIDYPPPPPTNHVFGFEFNEQSGAWDPVVEAPDPCGCCADCPR